MTLQAQLAGSASWSELRTCLNLKKEPRRRKNVPELDKKGKPRSRSRLQSEQLSSPRSLAQSDRHGYNKSLDSKSPRDGGINTIQGSPNQTQRNNTPQQRSRKISIKSNFGGSFGGSAVGEKN